jgi:hypothetical protein
VQGTDVAQADTDASVTAFIHRRAVYRRGGAGPACGAGCLPTRLAQ